MVARRRRRQTAGGRCLAADGPRHLFEPQSVERGDRKGREEPEAAVDLDGDLLDRLALLLTRPVMEVV